MVSLGNLSTAKYTFQTFPDIFFIGLTEYCTVQCVHKLYSADCRNVKCTVYRLHVGTFSQTYSENYSTVSVSNVNKH